jgi:hypothetical protein
MKAKKSFFVVEGNKKLGAGPQFQTGTFGTFSFWRSHQSGRLLSLFR